MVRRHERELAAGRRTRELAWNHGQGQLIPETRSVRPAEKIRSSEEDRVKRCRHSSCFVEFSLVTHASVSLHMHVVLHTLLQLWVNPKHCSCLFVCSIFLPLPRSYSCSGKKCTLPPSDHWLITGRPRREMAEDWWMCGGEGGIVTQLCVNDIVGFTFVLVHQAA